MTSTIQAALAHLAGICDGASSRDGQGFSGSDAEFGRDLARKGEAYGLSAKQHACAKRLVHKYRKQLGRAGFDAVALAAEQHVALVRAAPSAAAVSGLAPAVPPPGHLSNRFAGRCACGTFVPVGCGTTAKVGLRWAVSCPACLPGAVAA